MLPLILFYIFATVLVLGGRGGDRGRAIQCIRALEPGAVFRDITAAIWLLIEAEFLAIVLVLVYVGAVMVLFLFVVMMLDIDLEELRAGFTRSRMARHGSWPGVIVLEIAGVVVDSQARHRRDARRGAAAGQLQQHPGAGGCAVVRQIRLSRSRSPPWCCWWPSLRQLR